MIWQAHKVALFPSLVRVCGLRLAPLTVGRYQILEHLESPYLAGGVPLAGDFLGAVLVCWLPRVVSVWLIRRPIWFGVAVYLLARWIRIRRMQWTQEHVTFVRWVEDCTWLPERFKQERERATGPAGVPTSYRLIDALLDKFTEVQILRMSMPKANVHALAASSNSGREFESPEEYAANLLPEGFAYHETDYPTLKATLDAIRKIDAERAALEKALPGFMADCPDKAKAAEARLAELPRVDVRASVRAAVAADIKKMKEEAHAN